MFTGIIEHVGEVVGISGHREARVLSVDLGELAREVSPGDSVSVDGACLTATVIRGKHVDFDVSAETLRRTTLAERRCGDRVNVETALRVGDRIGGHFVSGHVDGVGTIHRKQQMAGEVRLEVQVPRELTDLMILKGSVAVDGISLTIAGLAEGRFEVALIPFTMAETTLREKTAGDAVNIECDMMGRWVKKLLRQQPASSQLTIQDLQESGF